MGPLGLPGWVIFCWVSCVLLSVPTEVALGLELADKLLAGMRCMREDCVHHRSCCIFRCPKYPPTAAGPSLEGLTIQGC